MICLSVLPNTSGAKRAIVSAKTEGSTLEEFIEAIERVFPDVTYFRKPFKGTMEFIAEVNLK